MRYWAFFVSKLFAAAALSFALFTALHRFWPAQQQFAYEYPPRFAHDLSYTLGIGLWFLLSCCMAYGAIWDQRYRCRVCLRRQPVPWSSPANV